MQNLEKILLTVPLLKKASLKSEIKIQLFPSLKSDQAVANLKVGIKLSLFSFRLFQKIEFKNINSIIKNINKSNFTKRASSKACGSLSLET